MGKGGEKGSIRGKRNRVLGKTARMSKKKSTEKLLVLKAFFKKVSINRDRMAQGGCRTTKVGATCCLRFAGQLFCHGHCVIQDLL